MKISWQNRVYKDPKRKKIILNFATKIKIKYKIAENTKKKSLKRMLRKHKMEQGQIFLV